MHKRHAAFTLVELSVVLAIIGLLVGGVMIGQSMIGRARLTGVINDFNRYKTAYDRFKIQYKAIPGDMLDATEYWGADTVSACSTTPASADRVAKQETCNGNGTGTIHYDSGVSSGYLQTEIMRAWQHLANAGYIEGRYTGVGGPISTSQAVPGQNVPVNAISSAAAIFITLGDVNVAAAATENLFAGTYGTALYYGAVATSASWSSLPYSPIVTPKNAYQVDSKIDDARPSTGALRLRFTLSPDCITSTDAATAEYDLQNKGIHCSFLYTIDRNAGGI